MRRRQSGQAAVEAIAVVPLIALVVVVAWQLAVVVRGALTANEDLRVKALANEGAAVVTVEQPVPSLLPGRRRLTVTARARIEVP